MLALDETALPVRDKPHRREFLGTIAALNGWTAWAGEFAGAPVALAESGQARLPIVAGSIKEPVEELARYLRRIAGATFQVEPKAGKTGGLYVGLTSDFPALKLEKSDELGDEGFLLRTDGDNVLLIGNGPLGVQHAVTTFLHKVGCRWFFPGAVWEVVPARKTLEVNFDERQVPSFSIGRHMFYGYGSFGPCDRDFKEWNRHNRMGGPGPIGLGHTWFGLSADRDFAAHPEWFALVAGQRKAAKPCYTHPDVLKQGIRHALGAAAAGSSLVSLSPPDGLDFCECERCLAVCQGGTPFKKHLATFAKRPDGVVVSVASETVFGFVNQVAAAVAAKYPRTRVGCMAYSAYAEPPTFKLHANVFVQATTAYRRTDLTLAEQLTTFRDRGCQAGLREYFSVYQWDWDAQPPQGTLSPAKLRDVFDRYHDYGVRCVNAEASNNWGPRGLSYYLAANVMWNTKADTDALLRDFYTNAFGPAAEAMQRFYRHWYGAAALDGAEAPAEAPAEETGERAEELVSMARLKKLFKDLDKAAKLTKDRPDCLARVDHLRMYLHYLLLRHRTEEAGAGKDLAKNKEAILDAVRAETTFGARLTYTNMIHSRPLLGKAFDRRFKKFAALLKEVPETRTADQGWRAVGQPPTRAEVEAIWEEDHTMLSGG
jgi:hypothetical protein